MGIPILPAPKGKGQKFGEAIGGGIQRGVDFVSQMAAEKAQQEAKMQGLLSILEPQGMQTPGEQLSGANQQPENIYERLSPAQKAILANQYPQAAQALQADEALNRKEKLKRETMAEPELLERERKSEGLESSGLRFDRLNQLFSTENEDKFPPATLAAALTKDGELTPLAQSLLSPEAHEAIKLLSDELSGAKDTFGARVTNFDLQAYMKRLPGLLMSPEGRRRVLRDLRIMNKLSSMHEQGVLDLIDQYGGPGKISVSKAERMWKKQNAEKVAKLKKEFINPGSTDIDELDETSAMLHPGVTIEDEETGQKFKSNGNTWEPVTDAI